MTTLVFGKSGQVSLALQRSAEQKGIPIKVIGSEDLDLATLSDTHIIADLIKTHGARAILNAAAYTAVDKAQSEPEKARAINAHAPNLMAKACAKASIPLIHVSTDFVFDGSATTPYREDAPTGPVSVYGETKLEGEQAIIQSGCSFAIIRTAWVFSADGNNFVKTMLRLGAEREELTIIADQFGMPTPAHAIAEAMLTIASQLIESPEKSGIYHFAGDEKTNWAGFARAIFDEAGFATKVIDIPTEQYPTPAKRPAWSVLDCSHILQTFQIPSPSWRAALRDVIATLNKS